MLVKPINTLGDEELAQVQVIYQAAFRPELRVPFSDLTRQTRADQTFVAMEGTVPVGFAALRRLGSVDWSFLRYFAIAGERCSQGLGRRFWLLLRESLRIQAWPGCVIFEVEDPDDAAGDDAERVIRERRVRFWTACGARLLAAPWYVLPDYTGSGMTEPVLLMAATPASLQAVRGDELRQLVLAIYTDRYGMAPDDPLVVRALASISA